MSVGPGRQFLVSVLIAIPLALFAGVAPVVRAERLPIITYGPADGLAPWCST